MTGLERAAKNGDRDEVQRLIKQCSDLSIFQKAIELANKGNWHAVSKHLQAALDNLAGQQHAAELLVKRGARQIPGKSAICPECGSPASLIMEERGKRALPRGYLNSITSWRLHFNTMNIFQKPLGVKAYASESFPESCHLARFYSPNPNT